MRHPPDVITNYRDTSRFQLIEASDCLDCRDYNFPEKIFGPDFFYEVYKDYGNHYILFFRNNLIGYPTEIGAQSPLNSYLRLDFRKTELFQFGKYRGRVEFGKYIGRFEPKILKT